MKNENKKYALVIVDVQEDFVRPSAPAFNPGAPAIIPNIVKLLEKTRRDKQAVFFVVREYRADGSDVEKPRLTSFLKKKHVVEGTPGCAIAAELQPLPGEYRLVKKRFSAFMNTELDMMLRRLGIEHIIVCGLQYPTCIRTTVFDAISYDYDVTLVTDATGAKTPAIAADNIRDIKKIGVQCLTTEEVING